MIGAGRAHAHVHAVGNTPVHACAHESRKHSVHRKETQTLVRTPTRIYKCANRPVRKAPSTHVGVYTSPTRTRTPVHVCTRRARTGTVHASPSTCVRHALTGLGTPTGSHEYTPVRKQKGMHTDSLAQTGAHTRVHTARTRTHRASRAHSFPQGTRLPSPSAAEARGGEWG